MVTIIKKGASKEEVSLLLEKLNKRTKYSKGFDAMKFCGTVKFKDDALKIQKQLRDEW